MTNPLEAVAFPQPDLEKLTSEWSENKVLPPDPRIPADLRLWYRLSPDGYLACAVWRQPPHGTYQLQIIHRTVAPTGWESALAPLAGRPPSLDEILECLRRFTRAGLPFMLLLITPATAEPWPNPVAIGVSQIPVVTAPPDLTGRKNHRGN